MQHYPLLNVFPHFIVAMVEPKKDILTMERRTWVLVFILLLQRKQELWWVLRVFFFLLFFGWHICVFHQSYEVLQHVLTCERQTRRIYFYVLIIYLFINYIHNCGFTALSGLFLHESSLACENKNAASESSSSSSTLFWAIWSALYLAFN